MILLVEDSKVQRIQLQKCLREGNYFDVREFENAEDLFAFLGVLEHQKTTDLILIDYHLPGISGIEAVSQLKQIKNVKDIPVIMLTASDDLTTLEHAFEMGVSDFLTKPVKKMELIARIRSMLKLKQESDARKAREQQLRQTTLKLKLINEALTKKELELRQLNLQLKQLGQSFKRQSQQDGLTGLANRRFFDETMRKYWLEALDRALPVAMIVLDVDAFKRFNDTYGHSMGDHCLQQVACALKVTFEGSKGFVARYGGEEFVLALPGVALAEAVKLAEHLRKAIEILAIPHATSLTNDVVTASFGVACLVPSVNESHEKLLQLADRALYQAKQQGRNRVNFQDDHANLYQSAV